MLCNYLNLIYSLSVSAETEIQIILGFDSVKDRNNIVISENVNINYLDLSKIMEGFMILEIVRHPTTQN